MSEIYCTHTTQEAELPLTFNDVEKAIALINSEPILVGIGINKTMYRLLKKYAIEKNPYLLGDPRGIKSWNISPYGMVPIYVKKHQKGYRLFYNKEDLQKYIEKLNA